MPQRTLKLFSLGTALILILMTAFQSVPVSAQEPLPEHQVVIIPYTSDQQLAELASRFDVIEVDHDQNTLKAIVTAQERQLLQSMGLSFSVDIPYTTEINRNPNLTDGQTSALDNYPCFRTIDEIYATGAALAQSYPNLAAWVDIGDSWEKTINPAEGSDIRVLVLGNRTNGSVAKSDIFIMSGIHAREWAPPELNTRFAEYLLSNYGVNADVTWLLDYNNVHLLLVTNPDGRTMDESNYSYLWRKNTNNNYCTNSVDRGADLNRNFPFKWAGGNYQCDEVYPGNAAGSEPEVQAILQYVRGIFPDLRGPGDNDSVNPEEATGLFIDLHSYSGLVMWPWGWTNSNSPNEAQLRTIGYKFAYYNHYTPQKSAALYPSNGTTEDWAYGELGLAGYCFEIGVAFHESCSRFESAIYPDNLQALLRAVKMARNPYRLAYGPETLNLAGPADPVDGGASFQVSAVINDTLYSTYGTDIPNQYISEARYTIDEPSWMPGAVTYSMQAVDGHFVDEKIEDVIAQVSTSGLSVGRHILFVEGKDAQGRWGPPNAIYFTVSENEVTPTPEPTPTATPPAPSLNWLYLPIVISIP